MAKTKYIPSDREFLAGLREQQRIATENSLYSNPSESGGFIDPSQSRGVPGIFEISDYYGKVRDIAPLSYGIAGLQEERAQNQSVGDKWGNALMKMGITAGTTFLDGTIGTLAGLANMAIEGEGSAFWDNSVSNYFANFQDSAEKDWFPIYYTQVEQERPWYENLLTHNFWADKVLKNMGFMIGTVASSALYGGATRSLLGAKDIAKSIGKGLAGKVGRTGNIGDDLFSALSRKEILAKDVTNILKNEGKQLGRIDFASQIVGSIAGSVGEARIEAIQSTKEYAERRLRENPSLTENQIADEIATVGNSVFLTNMAVLSLGNFFQFKNTIGGGYNVNKINYNGLTKGTIKEGIERAVPKTKLGKIGKGAITVGKAFKNPLWEGWEEQSQKIGSEASQLFYGKGKDDDSEEAFSTYLGAYASKMMEQFESLDNWEEFAIGFISGGMGAPTISRGKPALAGGMYGEFQEQRAKNKQVDALIKTANGSGQRNKSVYGSQLRNIALESEQKTSLENSDRLGWEIGSHAQIVNDINAALQLGRYEEYITDTKAKLNLTDEEIENLYKEQTEEGDKSKYENKSAEEIRKELNSRIAYIENLGKFISKNRDDLKVRFAGISDDVLNEILWYASAEDELNTKSDGVVTELSKVAQVLDGRNAQDIAKITSKSKGAVDFLSRLKIRSNKAKKTLANLQEKKGKAEATETKTDAIKVSIDKYAEQIKDAQKNVDKLAQDEKAQREKIIEETPELKGLTLEEFEDKIEEFTTKNEQLNKELKELYEYKPNVRAEVDPLLKDLGRIEVLREEFIKNLAKAYSANGVDDLQDAIDKFNKDKIESKNKKEFDAKFKNNDKVKDNVDQEIYRLREVNKKKELYDKDDAGRYSKKVRDFVYSEGALDRYELVVPEAPAAPIISTATEGTVTKKPTKVEPVKPTKKEDIQKATFTNPRVSAENSLAKTTGNLGEVSEDKQSIVLAGNPDNLDLEDVITFQNFLENNALYDEKGNAKYKGKPVKGKDLFTKEEWKARSEKLEEDGYIADNTVYLVIVDKDGKEQKDGDNLIFTTLSTSASFTPVKKAPYGGGHLILTRNKEGKYTADEYNKENGTTYSIEEDFSDSFNENAKAVEAKFALNDGTDWREEYPLAQKRQKALLESLPQFIEFEGKSKGFTMIGDAYSVDEYLKVKGLKLSEVEVRVATSNREPAFGIDHSVRKGFTYLIDKKNETIIQVSPRALENSEKKLIVDLLTTYCAQCAISDKGIDVTGANTLTRKDGKAFTTTIADILYNLIGFSNFYNTSNTDTRDSLIDKIKNVNKLKAAKKDDRSALNALQEEYNALNSHKRSIYFQNTFEGEPSVDGGYIVVGMKDNDTPNIIALFNVDEKGKVKGKPTINPQLVQALEAYLSDKWLNVNSSNLKEDTKDFVLLNKLDNGKVATDDIIKYTKGDNYKKFLLGEKADADNQPKIPLTSREIKESKEVEATYANNNPYKGELPTKANRYLVIKENQTEAKASKPVPKTPIVTAQPKEDEKGTSSAQDKALREELKTVKGDDAAALLEGLANPLETAIPTEAPKDNTVPPKQTEMSDNELIDKYQDRPIPLYKDFKKEIEEIGYTLEEVEELSNNNELEYNELIKDLNIC